MKIVNILIYAVFFFSATSLVAQNVKPVTIESEIQQTEPLPFPSVNASASPLFPSKGADLEERIIDAIAPEPMRNIYFIHGLGGDRSSWSRVNAFVNRTFRARSYLASYTDMGNARECGNDLYINTIQLTNQVNAQAPLFIPRERSILIAHSQGGIVSRAMDTYEAPGEFGGIVTFGTPHKGAFIINNKQEAYKIVGQTVSNLSEGPILEGLSNVIPNGWFFNTIFGNKVINTLHGVVDGIQTLGNDILPGFIDAFDQTNVPLSEEFKVGSPVLDQLSGNPNTAKVCFFGIEEDPVFWRELYNYKGKVPNAFNLWDANDDSPYVVGAINTLANYQSKKDFYRHRAQNTSSFFSPKKKARYQTISDGYSKGVGTLMTINDEFKAIIGSIRKVQSNKTICQCQDKAGNLYAYTAKGPCPQSPYKGVVCKPVPVESLIEEGSDGAVPESSASAYPGADVQIKMVNSNHQQMRNDANTERAIKGLMLGSYGKFFITTRY
ncbi:MAG: esterase/lipase family protein [Saprospiraceae bacterium]